MIRLATAADLPAVAAVYDAILDREAESGVCYTNWQKGKYPTQETTKGILESGKLYVGTDDDGTVFSFDIFFHRQRKSSVGERPRLNGRRSSHPRGLFRYFL